MSNVIRGKFGETLEGFPVSLLTMEAYDGIYGVNFNNRPVPPAAKRLFAKKLDANGDPVRHSKPVFRFEGVCRTRGELEVLIAVLDNGKRKFYISQRGGWLGLYIG